MEYKNYTDLSITSSKKPANTHLFIELANGYLLLVDSTSTTDLLISDDKGANWDTFDTGDFSSGKISRTNPIEAMWYDRANSKVYYATREQAPDNEVRVFYLDTSAYTETQVGAAVTDDTQFVDVYIRDGNLEVLLGDDPTIYRWGNPWAQIDVEGDDVTSVSFGVVVGTSMYFYGDETVQELTMYVFSGAAITRKDSIAGYGMPSVNQRALAYDGSDVLYFTATKDADAGNDYLMSYTISTNVIAEVVALDFVMMLDRNTASGIQEKGFHSTNYYVYELHPTISYQWYLISIPDSDAVFIGITDNFLMNNDGDMWEYEDVTPYVTDAKIIRADMELPTATFQIRSPYTLVEDLFISIKDMFTTAASSSSEIIFEGYVDTLSEGVVYTAKLVSPARELLNIRPSGDYSGRSDQIISSLISTYCKYITAGTLSAGGAMGTITFSGDKTMFQILYEFSIFDNFIWYITPTGALYYNSGAVDTGENFTTTSHISNVMPMRGKRAVNYVHIKGGFVSGAQVAGTPQEVIPDQNLKGKNPYERTHSHLNTSALCTTTATNALTRFGTQAKMVEFVHNDGTVGLMQEGETVTFEYTGGDFSVASAQYGIKEVKYDAVIGKGFYRISDRIL